MARKRYSDEECLKILRQVEVELAAGADVSTACRSAGISDATFYTWRRKFGSMGRSQLSELKAVCAENLNPHIMVMKPAEDRLRYDVPGHFNATERGGIFV
jgi:putative transposase